MRTVGSGIQHPLHFKQLLAFSLVNENGEGRRVGLGIDGTSWCGIEAGENS